MDIIDHSKDLCYLKLMRMNYGLTEADHNAIIEQLSQHLKVKKLPRTRTIIFSK
jgi:hypothetical protein